MKRGTNLINASAFIIVLSMLNNPVVNFVFPEEF